MQAFPATELGESLTVTKSRKAGSKPSLEDTRVYYLFTKLQSHLPEKGL